MAGGAGAEVTPTPTATPTATPAYALTLDDDFETDGGGWADRSGTGMSCTVDGSDSGQLEINNKLGICHYSGVSKGVQPTKDDQWAVLEMTDDISVYVGPAVRLQTGAGDPDPGIYNYVLRCTDSELVIRVCDQDATCQTIAQGSSCATGADRQMALMVDGEGDSTELCAWYWNTGQSASSWDDPATWDDADFCTSEDGLIDNAGMAAANSGDGADEIEDWDTTSSTGPDNLLGFPVNTQFDTGIYSGNTVTSGYEWFMAGDNP
jgi:hypothetical protein